MLQNKFNAFLCHSQTDPHFQPRDLIAYLANTYGKLPNIYNVVAIENGWEIVCEDGWRLRVIHHNKHVDLRTLKVMSSLSLNRMVQVLDPHVFDEIQSITTVRITKGDGVFTEAMPNDLQKQVHDLGVGHLVSNTHSLAEVNGLASILSVTCYFLLSKLEARLVAFDGNRVFTPDMFNANYAPEFPFDLFTLPMAFRGKFSFIDKGFSEESDKETGLFFNGTDELVNCHIYVDENPLHESEGHILACEFAKSLMQGENYIDQEIIGRADGEKIRVCKGKVKNTKLDEYILVFLEHLNLPQDYKPKTNKSGFAMTIRRPFWPPKQNVLTSAIGLSVRAWALLKLLLRAAVGLAMAVVVIWLIKSFT